MRGIVLAALFAGGCSQGWERSDDAMLRECWGAARRSDGAYGLRFEAIVIVDDHHGNVISAHSRTCRNHRLRFAEAGAEPQRQLNAVKDEDRAARSRGDMQHETVVRGNAILVPLGRTTESQLYVRIIEFQTLEVMSQPDARRFVRDFNI